MGIKKNKFYAALRKEGIKTLSSVTGQYCFRQRELSFDNHGTKNLESLCVIGNTVVFDCIHDVQGVFYTNRTDIGVVVQIGLDWGMDLRLESTHGVYVVLVDASAPARTYEVGSVLMGTLKSSGIEEELTAPEWTARRMFALERDIIRGTRDIGKYTKLRRAWKDYYPPSFEGFRTILS